MKNKKSLQQRLSKISQPFINFYNNRYYRAMTYFIVSGGSLVYFLLAPDTSITNVVFILAGTIISVVNGMKILFLKNLAKYLIPFARNNFDKFSRKNAHADLERYRAVFTRTGFIIAIGIMILAFNWKDSNNAIPKHRDTQGPIVEPVIIPPTKQPIELPKKVKVVEAKPDEIFPPQPPVPDSEFHNDSIIPDIPDLPDEPKQDLNIYIAPEVMPEFPGGQKKLSEYLENNFYQPPKISDMCFIQGTAILSFVVNSKGIVTDVTLLKGICPVFDKEAIRIIKDMPRWKPGEQNGIPVSVLFNQTFTFSD